VPKPLGFCTPNQAPATLVIASLSPVSREKGFCTPVLNTVRAVPVLMPSAAAICRQLWPALRSSTTLARSNTARGLPIAAQIRPLATYP
jgi:hypothetical protein